MAMTHHEIEACVIRAKAGNQDNLLKILEQYKPFIFKMANQFNIKSCDTYDLLQIGYIAVINSVMKYKTGSHTFSTYAYNSIKNAFKYTARKNASFGKALSINTEFIDCIEGEENLEDSIISSERLEEVRSAVAKLPEDEMELIIMVYFSGVSLTAYAKRKQVDYFEAFRKRNRILEKLSRYIKR
jgi:RNA polymerase sigma factor (sigma-70 family)